MANTIPILLPRHQRPDCLNNVSRFEYDKETLLMPFLPFSKELLAANMHCGVYSSLGPGQIVLIKKHSCHMPIPNFQDYSYYTFPPNTQSIAWRAVVQRQHVIPYHVQASRSLAVSVLSWAMFMLTRIIIVMIVAGDGGIGGRGNAEVAEPSHASMASARTAHQAPLQNKNFSAHSPSICSFFLNTT